MNKNQEIKHKKSLKGGLQASKSQHFRAVQKYQYQTSQTNYNINVNCEQSKTMKGKDDKGINKSHKKIKYITQGIEKSNWIEAPRQNSNRKDVTIKVSTLNNIEDLNVYEKAKSGKKSKKGSSKQKKQDKFRHNPKVTHQNNKIKMRDVKSHSKSVKKLTLKSFASKSKDKSKSKNNLKPKSSRQGQKKDESLYPANLDIQNSYYFSNFPETPTSPDTSERVDKSKTNETSRNSKKKSNMYLFQSKDESWKKPKKSFGNLQATVDFLN